MITPRDQFKTPISVGDIITYPGRKKNDTYMRTARVDDMYEVLDKDGYPITALKVIVAIVPRAKERRTNPLWQEDIKFSKTNIKNTWKSTIISKAQIQHDSRYCGLLDLK